MRNKLLRISGILLAPVILFIIFSLNSTGFGINSLYIILSQTMIPLVIGYGFAFCIQADIFDLSVGSKIVFAAVIGGLLCNRFGLAGLILGSILGGIAFGAVMGLLHNMLRIPSLVLSLGIVMLLEVLNSYLAGRQAFLKISSAHSVLGRPPNNIILTVILGVVFYLLFYHTRFSFHARMVGRNELLAKNMGIHSRKIILQSYIAAGFFYGCAGILLISYSSAVTTSIGMASLSMVFQPMMGVLIGLELLSVVDNLLFNIFIGEFCISMIFNGLIAMGLPATMQDVALGVFIIIIMSVSTNRKRMQSAFRRMRLSRKEVTERV